ncbi:MAG: hypothetical protein M5U28_36740 [Sandaracinaceae bacterium]|nr:hypothetical protein [Sandaracinaceae bacterium]
MTRTAASRRERFLPYRYARGGVELRVVACTLDGKTDVAPEDEAHVLDLEGRWTRAALALAVSVPEATLARVLPSGAPASDLEVAVVLRCPATLLRIGTRVALRRRAAWRRSSSRSCSTTSRARRSSSRTWSAPRAASAPGYAGQRGARVADSRAWELRVDRPREPKGEHLDVRYRRFSEDATIPARDRKNLYALDLDQPSPILWLNADHERVAAVLDSRGTVGRHARLREAIYDHVAHAVWTQLFLKAAGDYVRNEETTYPWQDAVLDLLLRDVFPEVRRASDRRDELATAWDDLPSLLARLDAGLQRRNDLALHLTRLVEEEGA